LAPFRISVVTPCLNRAGFIADAVESVLAQDDPDVEHIVMDGGSTDGTLEVLARYPHLRVASGPDQGLYDAINHGIGRASGAVVAHLNSDDLFAPGAFRAVREAFAAHPGADMIAGGADLLEAGPDGAWRPTRTYAAARHAPLSLAEITVGIPVINARFFRREVYDRVGLYDPGYPISADRDLLLRALLAGVGCRTVEPVLYHYRSHPGSLTMQARSPHALARTWEYLRMSERYFADPSIPPEVRAACRRWHGKEAMDGAVEALRRLMPAEALRFAWEGWRRAPLFPASLAGSILWRIVRFPFKRAA
jgi:glycosyltransferase involved in cell wall biosynthesis